MKTLSLGPVSFRIAFEADIGDDEDSIVAVSRDGAFQIRTSAIGVLKDGLLAENAGTRFVEERCIQENRRLFREGSLVWFSCPDSDMGGDADTTTWFVGFGTHVVVISATIEQNAHFTSAIVARHVDDIIGSLIIKEKAAEPGATDNPDGAQRSREDY